MKQVPYAAIRLVGGVLAALWCIYVFWREGSVGTVFLGMALFAAGWLAAQRFGRPVGLTNKPPWLDTVLPVAIAAFAVLPAALYPFIGSVSVVVLPHALLSSVWLTPLSNVWTTSPASSSAS